MFGSVGDGYSTVDHASLTCEDFETHPTQQSVRLISEVCQCGVSY